MFNMKSHGAKRIISLLLSAVMIAGVLAGCSATVNDPVVGKVGDVELTYSQLSSMYQTMASYYEYGIYKQETDDLVGEVIGKTFDYLVETALPIYIARRDNITLDAEEEAELAETVQAQLDEYVDEMKSSVTGIEGEEAIYEAALKLFKEYIEKNGVTYEELKADIEANTRDGMLSSKLIDSVTEKATATDAEVKEKYDAKLKADSEKYAALPNEYYTDYSDYISYGGAYDHERPLAVPEGYFYIKHILVKNPEEGNEEDADKDVDAIVAEIEKKLADGESFDELVTEYNEDTALDYYPNGYVISEGSAANYDEAFARAAMALAVGEVSGPVESSYGKHFIMKMGEVPTDPVPCEEVADEYRETLLTDKKEELYNEAIELWRSETDISLNEKRAKALIVTAQANANS